MTCKGCGMPIGSKALHTCTRRLEVTMLKNLVEALRKENAEFIRENDRLWSEVRRLSAGPAPQVARPALVAAVDVHAEKDRNALLNEIDRLRCIIYATPR